MERNFEEYLLLLNIQEKYFDDLMELGMSFRNAGQTQKASDIFKKGIELAETAKTDYWNIVKGLLD